MAAERRQCTARSKRSGERCKRRPIRGGNVCSMHGGKIPAVVARAQQRLALREASEYVQQEAGVRGPLSLSEVYDELLNTARITVQWRDLLERMLTEMQGEWRYTALGAGTEQLRSEVALFERAMTRSAKVLELIARLDIDARAAAISARQGEMVATAIRRAIQAGDLTPEQHERILAAIPGELRRITMGVGAG